MFFRSELPAPLSCKWCHNGGKQTLDINWGSIQSFRRMIFTKNALISCVTGVIFGRKIFEGNQHSIIHIRLKSWKLSIVSSLVSAKYIWITSSKKASNHHGYHFYTPFFTVYVGRKCVTPVTVFNNIDNYINNWINRENTLSHHNLNQVYDGLIS